jgi:hypothetical protein
MPTRTSITLTDAIAGTHVFDPRTANPESTILVDSAHGETFRGQKSMSLSLAPMPKSKSVKVKGNLSLPGEVQDADTGLYDVPFVGRFSFEFSVPELFTSSQRADLAALATSLLANSIVQGYVSDLDPMY